MPYASFHRASAALLFLIATALPGLVLAQGIEGPALKGAEAQPNGQGDSGINEYGWPNDYVAQVGAGVTNGTTTGFSGPEETASGDQQISLPPLPSAELCSVWQGTDAYPFCLEKVVQE